MGWKDSVELNLIEMLGLRILQRVLGPDSVHNDSGSCHSQGVSLSLSENLGLDRMRRG